MEPVAYEGHGAGAVSPPPAAPDPSYSATYGTTGTWYGYAGAAVAEQADARTATDGQQQTSYTGYGYDPGAPYAVAPAASVSWGAATYSSPDTVGEYAVQDPYATTGHADYSTADYSATDYSAYGGYGEYAPADPAVDPAAQGCAAGTAYRTDPTTGPAYGYEYGLYPNDVASAQAPYDSTSVQDPIGVGYASVAGVGHGEAQPVDHSDDDAGPCAETPSDAYYAPEHNGRDEQGPAYERDEQQHDEYAYQQEHEQEHPYEPVERPQSAVVTVPRPAGGRAAARAARRKPRTARRSALLTIAVPSVAVMGVAAAAAVSVSVPDAGTTHPQAHPHTTGSPDGAPAKTVTASSKLDTQLAGLRKNADEFAGRVSRDQARIDLKKRQAQERKRKEALRPKFVLPVTQPGLSATFGMAGTHWAALHTGIDFPVSWGTSVRAVTDGTVRTQWNSAYGYMAIVTASDGTETWYCHLSSYRIHSGKVKAGETIAYSGSSGNSTGPHLHFEVHPSGEGTPAVDPLPWLLGHGINPR